MYTYALEGCASEASGKTDRLEAEQQAVTVTIDLCIRKGCLVRYLEEHRPKIKKHDDDVQSEICEMTSEGTQRV